MLGKALSQRQHVEADAICKNGSFTQLDQFVEENGGLGNGPKHVDD